MEWTTEKITIAVTAAVGAMGGIVAAYIKLRQQWTREDDKEHERTTRGYELLIASLTEENKLLRAENHELRRKS